MQSGVEPLHCESAVHAAPVGRPTTLPSGFGMGFGEPHVSQLDASAAATSSMATRVTGMASLRDVIGGSSAHAARVQVIGSMTAEGAGTSSADTSNPLISPMDQSFRSKHLRKISVITDDSLRYTFCVYT